jgi:hypothetical protein
MEMFYKTLTMNDFHGRRLDVRSVIGNIATDVATEYDTFVFNHILNLANKHGISIKEPVFSIWLAKLRASGFDLVCEYNSSVGSPDYFKNIRIKLVQTIDSVDLNWVTEFVFDHHATSCKLCANKDQIDPLTYASFCQDCIISDPDKNPVSCKFKSNID